MALDMLDIPMRRLFHVLFLGTVTLVFPLQWGCASGYSQGQVSKEQSQELSEALRVFAQLQSVPEVFSNLERKKNLSISPKGDKVAYFVKAADDESSKRLHYALAISDLDGANQKLLTDYSLSMSDSPPYWSPEGSRIALSYDEWTIEEGRNHKTSKVLVYSLEENRSRILYEKAKDSFFSHPVWSPDGAQLAFLVKGVFFPAMDRETKQLIRELEQTISEGDEIAWEKSSPEEEDKCELIIASVDQKQFISVPLTGRYTWGVGFGKQVGWSPKGESIAISWGKQLIIYDLRTKRVTRKELMGWVATNVDWHKGGRYIGFTSDVYDIQENRFIKVSVPGNEKQFAWVEDSLCFLIATSKPEPNLAEFLSILATAGHGKKNMVHRVFVYSVPERKYVKLDQFRHEGLANLSTLISFRSLSMRLRAGTKSFRAIESFIMDR